MDDDRGNLALEYLRLADRLRPRWLVWENVPGVLSSNGGRDFGAILGGMVELGYGVAYRVLDAQFLGVAQRRRRVFVVGYLGDWRRAAAVLFERHSLSGNPAPRREAGQRTAGTFKACASSGGWSNSADHAAAGYMIPVQTTEEVADTLAVGANQTTGFQSPSIVASTGHVAHCLNAGGMGRQDYETETLIAHTLKGEGFDASEDGTGRGTPIVPVCFSAKDHGADAMSDLSPTLRAGGHSKSHANAGVMPAIAFALRGREGGAMPEVCEDGSVGTLRAADGGSSRDYVAFASNTETMYGVSHADAPQTGPRQALRTMFEAAGEEAATEWCLGVLAAFWPAEVLRPEVHGRGVRCSAIPQRGLVNVALSRSQAGSTWTVQDLWEAGRDGRAPQGWRPHEQRASELGAYLSELPYSPSPAQRLLHDMWGASEGAGLLREALSALQEARRSACGEVQSAHAGSAVRRLTVEECEALQGFPRSYTLVPHRGKPAADGPRYKALGNSMAVPVMRWIGERIQAVEDLTTVSDASATDKG